MKNKNRFDCIVIGAGPAGSTAAYLLASNGFNVLILDKSDFPRDKLCAGLLTWKTIDLVESIFQTSIDLLKSKGVITSQSSTYGVCSNNHFMIKGKLAYPFHFVERRAYDSLWLEMALEAGALFRPNEKVVSLNHSEKQILTNKGYEFHGNFIFGADGALSRTRRLLYKRGLIKTDWKPGLATAFEVAIPKSHTLGLTDYPIIYFGHIPWGYAWCFPGKNRWLLGICGLNAKSGKLLRNGFKEFLESLGIPEKYIPIPSSHALPFGNYLRNPGYGNVLLVGDACGLADPLLGEGIYYAHKSSQLAAKAAMQSYHDPDAAIAKYTRYLKRDILIELRFARLARQIIYSLPGVLRCRVITSLFKTIPRRCEETIQGKRSFRWLRPIRR